jgi:hypothetical protein
VRGPFPFPWLPGGFEGFGFPSLSLPLAFALGCGDSVAWHLPLRNPAQKIFAENACTLRKSSFYEYQPRENPEAKHKKR